MDIDEAELLELEEIEKEVTSALYEEAFHLTELAVKADEKKDFRRASTLYTEASGVFLKVARLEGDKRSRNLLYRKITEYLSRAEKLKKQSQLVQQQQEEEEKKKKVIHNIPQPRPSPSLESLLPPAPPPQHTRQLQHTQAYHLPPPPPATTQLSQHQQSINNSPTLVRLLEVEHSLELTEQLVEHMRHGSHNHRALAVGDRSKYLRTYRYVVYICISTYPSPHHHRHTLVSLCVSICIYIYSVSFFVFLWPV